MNASFSFKKSALAGALLMAASSASAWDTWEFSGYASLELHHTSSFATAGDDTGWGAGQFGDGTTVPSDPACYLGSQCDTILGNLPVEAQVLFTIQNKTLGNDPIGNGQVDPAAPSVSECYTVLPSDYDASGNLVSGDIGAIERIIQHLHAPTLIPAAPQPRNSTSLNVVPDIFDICTDEEGKIESGYLGFFTSIPNNPTVWSITSFDTRTAVSFANGSAGNQFQNVPTQADADAIAASLASGVTPPIAPYGAANDWVFTGAGPIGYQTCDITTSCGNGGKAVPMPAFAAAALGLGLVGVTLLTGRRKSMK